MWALKNYINYYSCRYPAICLLKSPLWFQYLSKFLQVGLCHSFALLHLSLQKYSTTNVFIDDHKVVSDQCYKCFNEHSCVCLLCDIKDAHSEVELLSHQGYTHFRCWWLISKVVFQFTLQPEGHKNMTSSHFHQLCYCQTSERVCTWPWLCTLSPVLFSFYRWENWG